MRMPCGMPAPRTPPTAGSWLYIYELMTLEPGALSQDCGEEKPKGTEQLNIDARGRSNIRRTMQGQDCGDLRYCAGNCYELEGSFLEVSLIK